jgi:hypothetical protein
MSLPSCGRTQNEDLKHNVIRAGRLEDSGCRAEGTDPLKGPSEIEARLERSRGLSAGDEYRLPPPPPRPNLMSVFAR